MGEEMLLWAKSVQLSPKTTMWEGLGELGRIGGVREGLGGFGRVWKGLGGFGNEKSVELSPKTLIWERLKGIGRIWKC